MYCVVEIKISKEMLIIDYDVIRRGLSRICFIIFLMNMMKEIVFKNDTFSDYSHLYMPFSIDCIETGTFPSQISLIKKHCITMFSFDNDFLHENSINDRRV